MNERLGRKVCDTQDSGDHIVAWYHGSYGTSSILPSDYNDNSVGCNMFVLDALHHEDHKDGLLREDCIQKQDKIPWLYVEGPGPTSHYDGTEPDKPPINAEFNDFGKKMEDRNVHVRIVNPQWTIRNRNERDQQINSDIKSRDDVGDQMVQFECSGNIRELIPNLGPLLRVGTFEGSTWTNKNPKTPCHVVYPHSVVKDSGSKNKTSMCSVQTCNINNDTNGLSRKSHPMVVDTITKPNRNSVATSIRYKLEVQDQDDDIGYVKGLDGYIEEVGYYGFEHIIVIGERYDGILFMDCFGRLFDLDAMSGLLWLRGDYNKIAERKAKGLVNDPGASWIFVVSEGIVVEVTSDVPYGQLGIIEKTKKNKKNRKKKR
ncbi:hypothetical protein RhiirA5_451273 [Rhizophagus irregularis]|uniref:Uncharacterized protein n=1 Tax=Rhizophagus irregularis TaxID=588596 RepID=A0A2N0Q6W3_9GLOM|nr:hypothetical protein RhiirA5_451273 [Rhizophagus irregularis]